MAESNGTLGVWHGCCLGSVSGKEAEIKSILFTCRCDSRQPEEECKREKHSECASIIRSAMLIHSVESISLKFINQIRPTSLKAHLSGIRNCKKKVFYHLPIYNKFTSSVDIRLSLDLQALDCAAGGPVFLREFRRTDSFLKAVVAV